MNSLPADNPPKFPEPPVATFSAMPGVAAEAPAQAAPSESAKPAQSLQRRKSFGQFSSLLVSAMLHGLALLLLSLLIFPLPDSRPLGWLEGAFEAEIDSLELDVNELAAAAGDFSMAQEHSLDLAVSDNLASSNIVQPSQLELPATVAESTRSASVTDAMSQPLASRGGGLEGRSARNRRSLALTGGGTAESESAVERGLAWLAAHQYEDGSWRFDHTKCIQCNGQCRHPGFRTSTTDSTGLALLCFLGAGYTHYEGPYQETVANGLYYLQQRMLLTSFGADLRDKTVVAGNAFLASQPVNGNMYSQAIATLALCEAYGMTGDDSLGGPAQEAVNFIVHAQHKAGGWRYEPGQPGDTSVTGWQLAALKSALLADREVPREVWYRASSFLDSMQEDRGASYGYQGPSNKQPSMSVVGLFSRMMLGWPRDHAPLRKGIVRIGEAEPSKNHIYFNYYASQVLHHHGGPSWERWNPKMRDFLISQQATQGHERGSWYIDEDWSDRGGRLYTTTLAILTLEVYYRYMPMYQEAFINDAP